MPYDSDYRVYHMLFMHRENGTEHYRYDEELELLRMVAAGDMRGVELSRQAVMSDRVGHLSDDPLRNLQYLFIATITLITRFAIEAGIEEGHAYCASDSYIQQVDRCTDEKSVMDLYTEMIAYFTQQIAANNKKNSPSKPVMQCITYIEDHLHEKISVKQLAKLVGMNPNYLSGLFKQEIGQTISDYIMACRMEAARDMLLYSEHNYAEIASFLAFNSQSYFIKVFHETYGMTPKEYREKHYRKGLDSCES